MTLCPNKDQYHQLVELIEKNHSIVVFRHIRPDGDAYGSQWGLVSYLKQAYPQKQIYGVGENNGSLKNLFPEVDVISDDVIKDSLVIVTDTSNRERIDDQRYHLGKAIIKIDHHITADDYGDLNIVNSQKSSCAEMIAEFIRTELNEEPVNSDAARYLVTGMKTDTLSFGTNRVDWVTFSNVTYLMRSGSIHMGNLTDAIMTIEDNVFDYVTYLRSSAQSDCDNRLVFVYIEPDVLERFNISVVNAKEHVNVFKQKHKAEIWLVLVNEDGLYNVSMRSRHIVINDVAQKYGGGGHDVACATRGLDYQATIELIEDLKNKILNNS